MPTKPDVSVSAYLEFFLFFRYWQMGKEQYSLSPSSILYSGSTEQSIPLPSWRLYFQVILAFASTQGVSLFVSLIPQGPPKILPKCS